ncbi:4-alpha-glucanotransferase [Neptunicella sp. SCSIO 80796]|uniref:4-alpha-glucanotransferase n=1 Tax=Neptunicella plasticusilytica TaxID=3117012 RepID=UPI003A4D7973
MGLDKLFYLQGIGAEFIDCFGNTVVIPDDDRKGILQTMCADQVEQPDSLFSQEFIDTSIYQLDAAPWKVPLPAFQWCYADDLRISLYLPADLHTEICVCITTEQGVALQVRPRVEQLQQVGDYRIGERSYCHYQFSLYEQLNETEYAQLGMGYHQIEASFSAEQLTTSQGNWMIAPRRAFQTEEADRAAQPCWGLNIQLYALRSKSPWQIGDLGDLNDVINWVAKAGADFILVNPLHALNIAEPDNASPYSPCDRRRLNPLYIQIEKVAEYKALPINSLPTDEALSSRADDADNWLDYAAIYQGKYLALIELFKIFESRHLNNNTARNKLFHQFVKRHGSPLQQFAANEAANAPQALRQPVEFYLYLQFIAETQLQQCQENARKRGMQIGLIRDLAVGAVSEGEEVSANAEQFCLQASIGAPPDPFAPQGQNWQLAPLDPVKLKQHNYQHFIQLIRTNMSHCGALRMDHIMSLMRLWWWPRDDALGNGAYVYYPFDTLLAILCLESHRAHCLLIGEDLGVVPPEIVSRLYDAGIISNELFYFCKDDRGFKSPEHYKNQNMMMLTNHDVPTLTAWWSGFDLDLRHQLGLFGSQQELDEAHAERRNEKHQVVELLVQQGKLEAGTCMEDIPFDRLLPALVSVVASGSARLFSIPLSDLMGDKHPVNIPGTWKEYPNWRRRHPATIKDCARNKVISTILAEIAKQRPKREINGRTTTETRQGDNLSGHTQGMDKRYG